MEFPNSKPSKKEPSLLVLIFVTILIGIVSGIAGMFLVLLLHYVQHLAYGYNLSLTHPESFLEGVSASTGQRRMMVLSLCGLIAGFGWWAIHCFAKPLLSIEKAIHLKKPKMPLLATILNALLQMITVALGSPLGREVAPRELGAAFACWLAEKTGLDSKNSQIMVACGAGAGLAAVYNVPLGGTVFILEVLLFTLNWSALLPALCTCAIATTISWIGLGNAPQYHLSSFSLDHSIVLWSILTGPLFGIAAYYFREITLSARSEAPKNWRLCLLCFVNFVFIGFISIHFPALLGNGKGPIQLGFSNNLGFDLAFQLLALRVLIVWTSLRAGAVGGLMTPSIANGVLLAITLGSLWSFFWPGIPIGAFSVIGAAAFLAAAQKMPLTAIVLTAEFTSLNFSFLVPILFAVMGAISIVSFCEKKPMLTLH